MADIISDTALITLWLNQCFIELLYTFKNIKECINVYNKSFHEWLLNHYLIPEAHKEFAVIVEYLSPEEDPRGRKEQKEVIPSKHLISKEFEGIGSICRD